jgi:hypothetical protein
MTERRGLGKFRASSLLSTRQSEEPPSPAEAPPTPSPEPPVAPETPDTPPLPPSQDSPVIPDSPAAPALPDTPVLPPESIAVRREPVTLERSVAAAPAATPPRPEAVSVAGTPGTPETPVLQGSPRGATGNGAASRQAALRDTVYLPPELERRLSNAVYWARLSKNRVYLEGVERVLAELEAANGGAFPDIPGETVLKHAKAARRRER